jgi:hypothetical protein
MLTEPMLILADDKGKRGSNPKFRDRTFKDHDFKDNTEKSTNAYKPVHQTLIFKKRS